MINGEKELDDPLVVLQDILGPTWETARLKDVLRRFQGDLDRSLDFILHNTMSPPEDITMNDITDVLHDMFRGTVTPDIVDTIIADLGSHCCANASLFDEAVERLLSVADLDYLHSMFYPYYHTAPDPRTQETRIKQVMKHFRPNLLDKCYVRGVLEAMGWNVSAAIGCISGDDSWTNKHTLNNRHHTTYMTALTHNIRGAVLTADASPSLAAMSSNDIGSSSNAHITVSSGHVSAGNANWEAAERACHDEASLHFEYMREAYRGAVMTRSSDYAARGKEHRELFTAALGRAAVLALQGRNEGLAVTINDSNTSITIVNIARRLISSPVLRLDLHGLTVAFAKSFVTDLFQYSAKNLTGDVQSIVLLVGRGIHSSGGVQQVSPALWKLFADMKLKCVKLNDGSELKIKMADLKSRYG